MKLTELVELSELFERLINKGDRISDFGIDNEHQSIYITLESGEYKATSYEYFLEKTGKE